MFDSIQSVAGGLAVLTASLATGAAWIACIAAPNCSFDRLDYSRADGHVRQLIRETSGPIAVILLGACALAVLAGFYGSATLSGLAAIGFLTNNWTLAPKKKGENAPPPGVRHRKKSQRIVAISLSLMFTAVAAIAAILAVFHV